MSRLDLIQVFGNENAEIFNKISHAYELGITDERANTINEMLNKIWELLGNIAIGSWIGYGIIKLNNYFKDK